MSRSNIVVLLGILCAVVAFFLIVTPSRSESSSQVEVVTLTGWENVQDDLAKKISFRWLAAGKAGEQAFTKGLVEERFNVEFVPMMFGSAEAFQTKLPMLLAAGEVPDAFNPGGSVNVRKFAHHGFLMEVPYELLLEHCPNLVRLVNEYAPNMWPGLSYERRNYTLPLIWADGLHPRTGIWRMDWLKSVGIDTVPETLEEVYIALYRFRHNDPDGNGKKDTYGMSGDLQSWYVTFTEIFGAYGVLPFDWMERNGKVVWGGLLPETKEALGLLRKWYQEELIHPDFLTDRWYAEVNRKLYNGRIGYHNYMASYEAFDELNPSSVLCMMRELQPEAELTPGHPPIGPEGKRGHRVWGAASGFTVAFGKHMAERPEVVIRLLRMFDAIATDERLYLESRVGRQGMHWEWRDPEVGQASGIKHIPPFDTKQRREQEGFIDPVHLSGAGPFSPCGGDPKMFTKYLPAEMVEFRQKHRRREWGRVDLFNWPEVVPMGEEYLGDLRHLQQTFFAEIIEGTRPLDDFDEFVKQWKEQGGDLLLAEAQKLYEFRREIFRKVGIRE